MQGSVPVRRNETVPGDDNREDWTGGTGHGDFIPPQAPVLASSSTRS